MRISDWSSDVCSSDLAKAQGAVDQAQAEVQNAVQGALDRAGEKMDEAQAMAGEAAQQALAQAGAMLDNATSLVQNAVQDALAGANEAIAPARAMLAGAAIGRAASRERVWQYVVRSVAAVSFYKQNQK